jgi:hypothetical protein
MQSPYEPSRKANGGFVVVASPAGVGQEQSFGARRVSHRTSDLIDLRASHIKASTKCNDAERQDPANGQLLAPHVDHLFNEGSISFVDNGTVLLSPRLDMALLKAWGLANVKKVAAFFKV